MFARLAWSLASCLVDQIAVNFTAKRQIAKLLGATAIVDGRGWVPFHGAMNDIVRVELAGKKCTLTYHPATHLYTEESVTSAAVVAYTADGRIALAQLDRGPDLPGGHIQSGDLNIEAAVRRETIEETGITLTELALACVIESDYFGPEQLTYMLVYTAGIADVSALPAETESAGVVYLTSGEFLTQYQGDHRGMTYLLQQSHTVFQQNQP